ncbi:MAG: chorismate mutase [Bryobacterales bacterium]|nr:chorismate mutase [Bryobacterales bacterium]
MSGGVRTESAGTGGAESTPHPLSKQRAQIDALDVEILHLLNARTSVVEEIGRIKEQLAMPVYEPKREDSVMANVLSHNNGPLDDAAVRRIFERIVDEMRSLQKMRLNASAEVATDTQRKSAETSPDPPQSARE